MANAQAAGSDGTAALTPQQIAAAVERFPGLDFTSEHRQAQRAVMDQLGTGGRLAFAIGVAGSGKSTLLKPLVDAWQRDGRQVHGIALAWRQSDDLTDAGITAQNARAVESFLRSVEKVLSSSTASPWWKWTSWACSARNSSMSWGPLSIGLCR